MKRLFLIWICCIALFFIGTFLWDANILWRFSAPEASDDAISRTWGKVDKGGNPSAGIEINDSRGNTISCESFYDEKLGVIFYFFENKGKQPVWIKSEVLTKLTGKRWKMPPESEYFVSIAAPLGAKMEHEKISFLGEEKLWRFGIYLANGSGSMSWYVPVDFK